MDPPDNYVAVNPAASADATNRYASSYDVTFDAAAGAAPLFSDLEIQQYVLRARSGRNFGGSPQNAHQKDTFSVLEVQVYATACGQRFVHNHQVYGYGGGDLFVSGDNVHFWGGVTAGGDEGQCFRTMHLLQATAPVLTAVLSAVPQTAPATTLASGVTKSATPQTVLLADVTGLAAGQWLVVEPHNPADAGYPDMEAVKVLAVDAAAGAVTAVFVRNHAAGAAVSPAVVLALASLGSVGQQRWLVNLTAPGYAAGTAAGVRGSTGFTGAGTAWSAGMAGGDAANPGVISLAADDEANPPFSPGAGRLRAWYPIASVSSGTSLNVLHRSAVGVAGYTGRGTAPGAYEVRPGAMVLAVDGGNVVLSPNAFAWSPGDRVECAISPDADVTGEYMRVGAFMPGGTYRRVYYADNEGPRQFDAAFEADRTPMYGPAGVDAAAYDVAFHVGQGCPVNYGLRVAGKCLQSAIDILTPAGGSPHLTWGGSAGWGLFWNEKSRCLELQGAGSSPGFGSNNPLGRLVFNAGAAGYPDVGFCGTLTLSPGTGAFSTKIVLKGGGLPAPSWEVRCNYPGTAFSVWSSALDADALSLDSQGNALLGQGSRATNSPNGFPYVPSVAGPPVGVPAAKAGFVPLVYDTAGHKLWVFDGGRWRAMAAA